MKVSAAVALEFAAVIGMASVASAGPVYVVHFDVPSAGCSVEGSPGSSTTPLAGKVTCSDINGTGFAAATAITGSVGAEATGISTGATSIHKSASADASYSDQVIFSGPSAASGTIPVGLFLLQDGALSVGGPSSAAGVEFQATLGTSNTKAEYFMANGGPGSFLNIAFEQFTTASGGVTPPFDPAIPPFHTTSVASSAR